jgi:hypothetical protein
MKIHSPSARVILTVAATLLLFAGVAFAAGKGWVIFSSPNVGQTNFLTSVTALSSTDAWAAGYAYDANAQQLTVVQHWDGASWSSVPSPNPGTAQQCGDAFYAGNTLAGVDAVSPNDVWAVGSLCGPGTARTLAMHWDGNGWSVVPSPNHAPLDASELLAVSASGPNDVWAVGDYQVAFQYQWDTLVEHWNGSTWSIVSTPDLPGSDVTYLTGVAALSPTDVWAVGYTQGQAVTQTPLIEHYDGQSWSIVPAPFPEQSDFNALYSVAAISANDVWAIGYQNQNDQGQTGQGLIEHWDGTQWTAIASPIAGNATILLGVTAFSSTDITAVGYIQTSNVQFLPVTEHWNGSSWTLLKTPDPGMVGQLYGAAAVNGATWAVGAYSTSRMTQGYMQNPLNLTMRNRFRSVR